MGIEDSLSEKVGPLPVWGYGAVLGAVAVGFMFLHRQSSDPTTTSSDDTSTDDTTSADDVMDANDSSLYTGNNSGDQNDASPPIYNVTDSGDSGVTSDDSSPIVGTTAATVTHKRTNALWTARGVTYASGLGHSATGVQNILRRYLNGKSLTKAQAKIVDQIVSHQGLPPNTKTAHVVIRKPATEPHTSQTVHSTVHKPAPVHGVLATASGQAANGAGSTHAVSYRNYTVKKGDTGASIAARYFGGNTAEFRRVNHMSDSDRLHVGESVKVI